MDKSIYEMGTSPRKLDIPKETKRINKRKSNIRIVEDQRSNNIKITDAQKSKQLKIKLVVVIIFAILLTISYRNSLINEIYAQIQSDEALIAELQKQNEQTIVSIENGLNLNTIEKEAKELLGMQKATSTQTKYVSLPIEDYITLPTTEYIELEEDTLYDKILDKIFAN